MTLINQIQENLGLVAFETRTTFGYSRGEWDAMSLEERRELMADYLEVQLQMTGAEHLPERLIEYLVSLYKRSVTSGGPGITECEYAEASASVWMVIRKSEGSHHINALLESLPRPPVFYEKLFWIVLTRKQREYVIGDFTEDYSAVVLKYGTRFASWWCFTEAFKRLTPLIIRSAKTWIVRVLKLKALLGLIKTLGG